MALERQLVLTPAAKSPFPSKEFNPAEYPLTPSISDAIRHPWRIVPAVPTSRMPDESALARIETYLPPTPIYWPEGTLDSFRNLLNNNPLREPLEVQSNLQLDIFKDKISPQRVIDVLGTPPYMAKEWAAYYQESITFSESSVHQALVLWALREQIMGPEFSQVELPGLFDFPRTSAVGLLFHSAIVDTLRPVFQNAKELIQQDPASLTSEQQKARETILMHQLYVKDYDESMQSASPIDMIEMALFDLSLPEIQPLLKIAHSLDQEDPLGILFLYTEISEDTKNTLETIPEAVRTSSPAIRDTFLGLTRYLSAIPEETTAKFLDTVAEKVSEQGNITGPEAASTLLEAASSLLDMPSELTSDERYILAAAVLQGGYSERSVEGIIDAAKMRLLKAIEEMRDTNISASQE